MATPNESKSFLQVTVEDDFIQIMIRAGENVATLVTLHPLDAEQLSKDLAAGVTALVERSPTLELFERPGEKEGGR